MSLDLEQLQDIFNMPKSTILIQGETGTGKSYIAKNLHEKSVHKSTPFISVDLACIKEELIESELFGHKKGSFTSAHCDKEGLLTQVQTGTLFLDEIGELSLESQKKLLLLLEERVFRPIGSNKFLNFNGHIIAATNINLMEKVKKNEFREDLFFRLNLFQFKTTPLRSNLKHLIVLAQEFISHFSKKYSKPNIGLTMDMIKIFENYPWPGNIRELKNAMEYMMALHKNDHSLGDFLPEHIYHWKQLFEQQNTKSTLMNPIQDMENDEEIDINPYIEIRSLPKNYSLALSIFEKKYLLHFLIINNFKINKTAKEINMSKTTLIYKKNKYGIHSKTL